MCQGCRLCHNRKITQISASIGTAEACRTLLDTWIVSQEWQGKPWRHRLVGYAPPVSSDDGVAILEVTGDDAGWPDEILLRTMAAETGVPVFGLFQVPNQPLDGRREDDLIAHTFVEFLQSSDPEQPLLVPMARSVGAAVDHIAGLGFERIVLTGASKRGWTCWLAGRMQLPQVVGIAPRVFDNLDLAAQADKQARDWGSYSPMVDDYSRRSLQELAQTVAGQALIDLVDPVRWLDQVTVPKLLVHGGNDPFWTVDATSVYWSKLADARLLVVPNQGHSIGRDAGWIPTLGAFAHACAEGRLLPTGPDEAWHEQWVTYGEGRRFEKSRWTRVAEGWELGQAAKPEVWPGVDTATLIQRYRPFGGELYALSEPVTVLTAG